MNEPHPTEWIDNDLLMFLFWVMGDGFMCISHLSLSFFLSLYYYCFPSWSFSLFCLLINSKSNRSLPLTRRFSFIFIFMCQFWSFCFKLLHPTPSSQVYCLHHPFISSYVTHNMWDYLFPDHLKSQAKPSQALPIPIPIPIPIPSSCLISLSIHSIC